MRHGSLFSGIGGFDLAAEWMGWDNVFHVERDPFCQQVLRHHFPKSESHEDIKEFDGTAYAGRVDIISGGFPCQPFSAAGKRAGTSDNRYLWPQMFRVIREARPTYVVAENVRGLLSWNEGLVLDTVCADLESEGYEVFPVVLPAASVNAPHRRDRIWIVAHANDKGGTGGSGEVQGTDGEVSQRDHHAEPCHAGVECPHKRERIWVIATHPDRTPAKHQVQARRHMFAGAHEYNATHPDGSGMGQNYGQGKSRQLDQTGAAKDWQDFPTVAAVCGGDDGLPKELDGITFPKWRRESIKAYGNAIVPQVALQIFRAIERCSEGGICV